MKFLIAVLAVIVGSASVSCAATITFQTGSPVPTLKDSFGNLLNSTTAKVTMGFIKDWTGSVAQLTALRGGADEAEGSTSAGVLLTSSFLASNFFSIGSSNSDTDYGNITPGNPFGIKDVNNSISGQIENSNWLTAGGSVTANSVQANGLVRGTKIFLIVHNGTETLDLSQATQVGIYSATSWTLSNSGVVTAANFTLSQVDTSAEVFRGSLGSLVTSPYVPEPSSMALLGVVGLAFLRRRR